MKHDNASTSPARPPHSHRVCPWFLGYLLANPIRRLADSPERLLGPFVRPGMTVLEPGCGMGFFSLPVARMVGPDGHVLCVDLQEKMLDGLRARARRAGLSDRIEAIHCPESSLGIDRWLGQVDLAVVIYMLHEVPDGLGLLRQIYAALKPGGRLFVLEPKGHVSPAQFASATDAARAAGFVACDVALPPGRLAMVMEKLEARG